MFFARQRILSHICHGAHLGSVALIFLFVNCHSSKAAPANDAANGNEVFSFQDYLGREWKNEVVRVPLTAAQATLAKSKATLLGPEGEPVAYQIVDGAAGQPPAIEILVNVKLGGKSTYKFDAASAGSAPATDLQLEETDQSIRLTNRSIGISIRKKLDAGQGPVESIRLNSGRWIGGSRLDAKLGPASYSAKIVQRGPVFCEVECRTEFGDGASWLLNIRLDANEPIVIINETMALGAKAGAFSLSLGDNFNPDQLFYRFGVQHPAKEIGMNATSPITPGIAFILEPWLRWWMRPEQGPVFSVYRDDSPDMLCVGAGFAGRWVDPKIPAAERTAPFVNLMQDEQGLHLDFVLRNGQRHWMIGALDKETCLGVLKDPKLSYSPSVPHQYVIKHGQFPLNVVKDYVLDWDNEKERYPHLLVTRAQVERYRLANAKAPPVGEAELERIVNDKPIRQWSLHKPLSLYFATGNERVGQFLAEQAEVAMQEAVDVLMKQPYVPYGSAPHHQQELGSAPLVADAVLDSKFVSPALRKKLLAQIAFCSYAVNRPDYWSEERGYSGNPNMTTSVYGYEAALGSAIATHPKSREWTGQALAGLKSQLYDWSDSNGGWLEAPHYAMVSYDAILGSALMAHNAGLSEMVFDPQMEKVINWFSKWSTPRDSRFFGYRHLPPVGNTYINEATGEFGILASIWKEKDPQFASQMQWMYRQHKSWEDPGIGGTYPTMAGYRQILIDASIPEKAPPWGSELFPKTGVVLRNKFPSDRETSVLLLAGSFGGWRSHWDDDSGSVTLWGKGRILADDFGYYGAAPIEDHNLPASPEMAPANIFDVKTFAPSKGFDYVSGTRGPWQRQIVFMKNEDPLAPNYFVISDTFKTAAPATWRMWFTANKITPGAPSTLVEGKEDVDTDVFFATPSPMDLKTEEKTRTSGGGILPDGTQGRTPTTQIGLIATAPKEGAMTYVLYPRLKTEKPPVFTSLADGKVVRIQSNAGTDYVFLSATAFAWKEGSIAFEGKAGAVRFRGKQLILSLGEAGSIGARGQSLTAKQAALKEATLPG